MLMLVPLAARAVDVPHETGSSKGYTCSTCHSVHISLGTKGYNNVCLTCHKVGDAYAGNKPFGQRDFADPFGTYTGTRTGPLYQTSHNWIGSDRVPAAGAQPPTDTYMNKSSMLNTINCARCHNIHGRYSSSVQSKPFLRTRNDNDRMCLDCHRARNTTNHTLGTHPVTINYAEKAAATPTKLNANPVNANPANPTSAMKLSASGAVLCTTCHGVHFTDSNSRTFDSATSAVMGHLSTSRGYLLRTDLRGQTSATVNICSNCHIKPNHNKRGQNVQCADCHGGHVDLADGSTPNVYLVNRYMNISTSKGAVRNKAAFYQYTGNGRNFKNGDVTKPGVCQACHVVPTGGSYPTEHNDASGSNGKLCMGCHVHTAADGAFSASCTQCHGYPPAANVASGPSGYAVDGARNYATSGVFKNEAQTPHTVHAGGAPYTFGCMECHKGNSHNTGTFQNVFVSADATLVSNGQGTTPSYNGAGNGTCTTYCHSNGAPAVGAYVTKSPQWGSGKGTIIGQAGECAACHDDATGFAGTAHVKHVNATTGKGYACATCHAATVNGVPAIISTTNHVNGQKDISFSGSVGGQSISGTCATVYCHSNGKGATAEITPTFATPSTGQCGGCHKVSPGIASGRPLINSNAHFAHMSSTYGPKVYLAAAAAATSCAKCHTYTTELAASHVNGSVDVLSGGGSECRTCHPNGAVPTWSGGRVTCESCHTGTASVINGLAAPTKGNFTSSGHGQASANYDASRQCNYCHDPNSAHISNALGTYKRVAVNDNTLCTGCHNDAGKVPTVDKQNMSTHVTAKGGAANMDCKLCHDVHGTANLSMIKATIGGFAVSFTNTSSGYVQMSAPYQGVCQVCHTLTAYYKRGIAETNHPTKHCMACHDHKGLFAFKPKSCDTCHGYPPAPVGFVASQNNWSSAKVEDYANGGGAHVKAGHIKPTAKPSEGWANCTVCHGDGASSPTGVHFLKNPPYPPNKPQQVDIRIDVDDNYKFNPGYPLGRNQYGGALNGSNTTGSCSNVSCHFQKSPVWAP